MLAEAAAIDPDSKQLWRSVGTTGAVGIEICLAILAGFYGGEYLDHRLGTTPWLKSIGFVAGVGAAIKALVRVVRQYNRSLEQDKQDTQDKQHEKGPPEAPK